MTSIQDSKPHEKQISQSFYYCDVINLLRNGKIVRCLWENKKTSEKSVFREAWSPELSSQSFPVSCFWSRGFVPRRKWNLMLLVHQNTGKENRYGKNVFAVLISTLGGFDRANKKRSVIYTLSIICTLRIAVDNKLLLLASCARIKSWKILNVAHLWLSTLSQYFFRI